MQTIQIETVKISDIKPHPKNPRVHPDSALEKLSKSIKEFGWTNPVLLSSDGVILAGHARVKAAERLGYKEIPAVRLPFAGAKADAYLIADNKLQDETDWDTSLLRDLIGELDTGLFDLELTGFNLEDLAELLGTFDANVVEANEHKRIEQTDKSLDLGLQKDQNWFYVTYYGDAARFAALQDALKEQGALKTEHEISADFFEKVVCSIEA